MEFIFHMKRPIYLTKGTITASKSDNSKTEKVRHSITLRLV